VISLNQTNLKKAFQEIFARMGVTSFPIETNWSATRLAVVFPGGFPVREFMMAIESVISDGYGWSPSGITPEVTDGYTVADLYRWLLENTSSL
jgi:hypothetical protein